MPAARSAAPAAEGSTTASGGAPHASFRDVNDPFLPGALLHGQNAHAAANLEFLLTRRGRDAALFVRKWLREAARKEGVQPAGRFKPGTVGAQELHALSAAIASAPGASLRHAPLLQLSAAAASALDEEEAGQWESLARTERALLLACSEGSEPACEQLVDLLGAACRGGLKLKEATTLMLVAYCLVPDYLPWFAGGPAEGRAFNAEQEARLRATMAEAVMACSARWAQEADPSAAAQHDAPWLLPGLRERLVEAAGEGNEDDGHASSRRALFLEVRDASQELLERLSGVARLRQRSAEHQGSPEHPPPLLARLAEGCIQHTPIEGLVHSSTSLAGLLKSGLGRIGLQRQPHPGDYGMVVIFVIGGVSVAEMHEVQAVVDAAAAAAAAAAAGAEGMPRQVRQPPKIIVSGSALLQPADVLAHVLPRASA